MAELNNRECKICLKEKVRILKGKYPNGKDKIWVDLLDRQWNGRICPDCNVIRSKDTMKRNRQDG